MIGLKIRIDGVLDAFERGETLKTYNLHEKTYQIYRIVVSGEWVFVHSVFNTFAPMYTAEKTDNRPFRLCTDNVILSNISKISKACEEAKNLMVALYSIEQDQFLYYNRAFAEVLGDNYPRLLDQGWAYWISLVDRTQIPRVKKQIFNFLDDPQGSKSLALRYHLCKDSAGKTICIKHEILIHRLPSHTLAVNLFLDISDKEKIENCFNGGLATGTRGSTLSEQTISVREKEVLQLIGDGYSSKQIADILCISKHTAISHRKHLIEKFQVKNTAQLIKRASKILEL